jgi:hypothetical protein
MAEDKQYATADRECAAAVDWFTAAQGLPVLEERGPAQVTPQLPMPAHRIAHVAHQTHMAAAVDRGNL